MRSNQRYTLWFVNQSLCGGQVCLYHDPGNAASNHADVQPAAWRVAAANPQVQVRFEWEAVYDFVWLDEDATALSRQFAGAAPEMGGAVLLGKNRFGYEFQPMTEQAQRGQLVIQADHTISAGTQLHTGIGMDGGATFVLPARPNVGAVFTLAQEAQLAYWISFGAYGFKGNDALDTSKLNLSARVAFPKHIHTMTAVLGRQNAWTVVEGPPKAEHSGRERHS